MPRPDAFSKGPGSFARATRGRDRTLQSPRPAQHRNVSAPNLRPAFDERVFASLGRKPGLVGVRFVV
jgi:hypothetical protein